MSDPGDPFHDWPGRTPLYGDNGDLLLVFTLAEDTRGGRPWADLGWRPPTADINLVSEAVRDAFAGYAFTSLDPALAVDLLDDGATELRHALSMSHALDPLPDPDTAPGIAVRALAAEELIERADELGAVSLRAYPPGHPDHEYTKQRDAADEMRQFSRGEILGPYLEVSTIAERDGRAVGSCIVVGREGAPPEGGPWIVDVFRDPSAELRGVGRSLIATTLRLASEADLAGVSLVVSHANASARHVYESLGFRTGIEAWTLALP